MSAQDQITAVADSARTPPAWLVDFFTAPSASWKNPSLLEEPLARAASIPSPISTALTSADGKKGFPKAGVQFIEDGGAKSGGQSR